MATVLHSAGAPTGRSASPRWLAGSICFAVLLLIDASSSHLAAQTTVTTDASGPASQSQQEQSPAGKRPTGSQFITVTPRRSRPQATPGDSFEIAADIQNISTKALYFNPLYVTMTPPPELDPQAPRDWYGTFPGDGSNYCEGGKVPNCDEKSMRAQDQKQIDALNTELDRCYSIWRWNVFHHNYACVEKQALKDRISNRRSFDKVVELEPGSTTTVFWNGHTRTGQNSIWSNAIAELILPPGPYSVTIVADFWDTQSGAEQKSLDHQSYSTVLSIPIVASELTIIIGSIVGGLIRILSSARNSLFRDSLSLGKVCSRQSLRAAFRSCCLCLVKRDTYNLAVTSSRLRIYHKGHRQRLLGSDRNRVYSQRVG